MDASDLFIDNYPTNNPILAGLADLMAGGDPDEVLWKRDQALPTNQAFMTAACEALQWLQWPHPVTRALIDQMAFVSSETSPVSEWINKIPDNMATAWSEAVVRARKET